MSRIKLSKKAYDNLLQHLVEMESRKTAIVDDQWVTDIKEKSEITLLLDDYLKLMDESIHNIQVDTIADNEFPFVAVGCLVLLEDANNNDMLELRIIPPYKEKIEFDDVSILSPMGRALLKKAKGESISVKAPAGEFLYKIVSIKFSDEAG